MPKVEYRSWYSPELTQMLTELEDPDAKYPTLRRFQELCKEERGIYMEASRNHPRPKADKAMGIDKEVDS